MSTEINVENLDYATINDTNHVVFYSAGYRKIGALSQFPVYAARYLYSSTTNTIVTAVSYNPFTAAISNARNQTIIGPYSSSATEYNGVSFYMVVVNFTSVGGLSGQSDINYSVTTPPECTGKDFDNNIVMGYKILTEAEPPVIIKYPITYSATNGTVTGPAEAAIGETVVATGTPNANYGITDYTTQIAVTCNDIPVPFTFNATTNEITFEMPDPTSS